MYTPSLSDIQALKAAQPGANLAPVYRDVAADLETPVSAFLKVARGDHSFLLESVEGGERLARYSFIGTEPYRVLRCGPYPRADEGSDPLLEIERELSRFSLAHIENSPSTSLRAGLPRFTGGAVGFLAYEVARHFEPRVPVPEPDPQACPASPAAPSASWLTKSPATSSRASPSPSPTRRPSLRPFSCSPTPSWCSTT